VGKGVLTDAAAALSADVFADAQQRIRGLVHRTPVLASATLSRASGFDVRLKAEIFQKTGSYKLRGPSNKLPQLSAEQKRAGVICSSAGNHAQGVALAAAQLQIPAVVVMASNATPSKIAATRSYGAEVVLHGTVWDEANAEAFRIADARGLTMVHPFDDLQLIAGQGTVGLEILEDVPDVDVVVVPIGGGGLISGVATAIRNLKPEVRVIGVESSGAPAMKRSVESGRLVTLEDLDCSIDGLRVKRVGANTLALVSANVEEIVTLPDEAIYDAVVWTMTRCKLVVEGAAAAPVAALLNGLIDAKPGAKVVCVLSGGNIDLERLRGEEWN
jgi:threonine dehydratase